MSGIFGIFHKDNRPVTSDMLGPMQSIMQLWAPHEVECCHMDAVGVGRVQTPAPVAERLPITDPENPDLFIIADARIDNRDAMYRMLNIAGAERRAISDSRLILLAYAKWGRACVEKLIGAFAFVIWDRRRKQLFCGRDHMGLRPFYYYDGPHDFIFASDLEAILACSIVPQRLNEPLLAAHLQEDTFFAEKRLTFWVDIVKLPPAHHLLVTRQISQLSRYWSLDNVRDVRLRSNAAYAERLRELLFEVVECRIQAEGPIGAHLSGGLDSSVVNAIAIRQLRKRGKTLQTYSWSPPPSELAGNEHDLINDFCQQYAIDCQHIDLTVDDVVRTYRRDFTRVPSEMMLREELVLRQAVQNGTRTILSGWGGDECVTGHGWGHLSALFLRGRWFALHRALLAYTNVTNPSGIRQIKLYAHKMRQYVIRPLMPESIVMRLYGRQSSYPDSWITPHFAEAHRKAVRQLRGPTLRHRPGVQAMQWRWLDNGHITKRLEAWAVNGARCGVAYHYPLLDRRILEFCLGVPPDQFIQNGWKRSLMRRAVDGLIPKSIQWERSKIESAAFEVIDQKMAGALPQLAQRLEADKHAHIARRYIDLPRLVEAANAVPANGGVVEATAITLACANVCKNINSTLT